MKLYSVTHAGASLKVMARSYASAISLWLQEMRREHGTADFPDGIEPDGGIQIIEARLIPIERDGAR